MTIGVYYASWFIAGCIVFYSDFPPSFGGSATFAGMTLKATENETKRDSIER